MARWKRGEAEIEGLLADGSLQKLSGAAADGTRLLNKAAVTLGIARRLSSATLILPTYSPTTPLAKR